MSYPTSYSADKVAALALGIAAMPGAFTSGELKEFFADGVYVRCLTLNACELIVGKVHLKGHVLIVLGNVEVYSAAGREHIEGLHFEECKPGAQRSFWAREDSWLITVHPNPDNLRDTEALERILVTDNLALAAQTVEGLLP